MDCIFCKVANREIDTELVYEDEKVVAFNDIQPQAPIHQLIIPRKHIATINELTAEDMPLVGHMIQTGCKLAKDSGLADDGYRLVMNCNLQGGQAVFHIHLHLLGGRQMEWPPG